MPITNITRVIAGIESKIPAMVKAKNRSLKIFSRPSKDDSDGGDSNYDDDDDDDDDGK